MLPAVGPRCGHTAPLEAEHVQVALVNSEGKVSATTAFGAAHGPLLFTVSVYCSVVPVVTGSGLSTFVIAKSAERVTPLSVWVADSLPAVDALSVSSTAVTASVWLTVAGAAQFTFAWICTLFVPPTAMVPRLQVTLPALIVQLPEPTVTAASVTVSPVGVFALTTTLFAVDGPLLLTSHW